MKGAQVQQNSFGNPTQRRKRTFNQHIEDDRVDEASVGPLEDRLDSHYHQMEGGHSVMVNSMKRFKQEGAYNQSGLYANSGVQISNPSTQLMSQTAEINQGPRRSIRARKGNFSQIVM
jgi:hypothetical protein